LRHPGGAATQLLRARGFTAEDIRARLVEIVPPEDEATPGQIPFTPGAKKVLELSLRESLSHGSRSVGPEDVLLGLIREPEGPAMQILQEGGATAGELREAMLKQISPSPPTAAAEARRRLAPTTTGIHLDHSPAIRRLLMSAGARALDDGRSEIQILDLLEALLREPTAVGLLAELGVDEAALRAAIKRRRDTDEPPRSSAAG
jgi:ATP-dependent Clp protease ATP-binding subunit ClpA